MQRRLAFILVLAIVVGVLPIYSFGESQYTTDIEKVVVKMKTLFSITDEYDTFKSQISTSGDMAYFYLNWADTNNQLDPISISTDDQGNVISYNKYKAVYVEPESRLPNFKRDEAIKKAEEFIGKVNKDIFTEIKLRDDDYQNTIYDRTYYLQFHRVKNGIPYIENSVNVSVDKYSGEVTDYYVSWDRNLVFPDVNKALGQDGAKQIFKDKIGLDLLYKTSYRIFDYKEIIGSSNYFLAYGMLNESQTIDAITGEVLEVGYYIGNGGESDEKATASGGITPIEQAEIDKLKDIKPIEKIEKTARDILGLGEEYKLQYKYLNTSWKNLGQYEWYLNFVKELEDDKFEPVTVTMDAIDGTLLNFYKTIEFVENSKAKINMADSLKLAEEYIQKINKEKFAEVEYAPEIYQYQKDGEQSYGFTFIRKIKEAYITTDYITVYVDAVRGEIYSYRFDWFNGALPTMDGIISKDKAYEVFFNELGFELKYKAIYDYNKPEGQNKEIKLVYTPTDLRAKLINPYNGELLDYSGEPYKTKKEIAYKDIENSYAKEKIQTMAEYGVGFSTENFLPTTKIVQKDFLYLLWRAMNPYRVDTEESIDNIYTELTNTNIIKADEIYYEKTTTKEEAIKYIIRAMNHSKIADLPNIYADIWADSKTISPGLKGYMNIAYGLKIIVGNNTNNIQPRYELQRQDAASIIYNYMFRS